MADRVRAAVLQNFKLGVPEGSKIDTVNFVSPTLALVRNCRTENLLPN